MKRTSSSGGYCPQLLLLNRSSHPESHMVASLDAPVPKDLILITLGVVAVPLVPCGAEPLVHLLVEHAFADIELRSLHRELALEAQKGVVGSAAESSAEVDLLQRPPEKAEDDRVS